MCLNCVHVPQVACAEYVLQIMAAFFLNRWSQIYLHVKSEFGACPLECLPPGSQPYRLKTMEEIPKGPHALVGFCSVDISSSIQFPALEGLSCD